MSRNKKPTRKKVARPVWLIVGLLIVVIALGGWIVTLTLPKSNDRATLEVAGRPSLRVDQEQIDIGSVKLGTTVQAAFKLTNVGDQPLRFTTAPYIEVVEGC